MWPGHYCHTVFGGSMKDVEAVVQGFRKDFLTEDVAGDTAFVQHRAGPVSTVMPCEHAGYRLLYSCTLARLLASVAGRLSRAACSDFVPRLAVCPGNTRVPYRMQRVVLVRSKKKASVRTLTQLHRRMAAWEVARTQVRHTGGAGQWMHMRQGFGSLEARNAAPMASGWVLAVVDSKMADHQQSWMHTEERPGCEHTGSLVGILVGEQPRRRR